MTGEQKTQLVNSWLSGESMSAVAVFHGLNKLTVERVIREGFTLLVRQMTAPQPPTSPDVDVVPVDVIDQHTSVMWPCGCQASGTWPLPAECPEHGAPTL